MTFQVIIPARYASSRFPGKPLAMLGGMTMIERVYRQVSSVVDNVCVATDDERIFNAVKSFGGNVVMTSANHRSGTDRIAEAYRLIGSTADVVVNVQGDEPFILPQQIQSILGCFDSANVQIATLARPFSDGESIFDSNIVKVVFSQTTHQALYFSRSAIPYQRGKQESEWQKSMTYYAHLGIYAYRADILQRITQMPPSPLEQAESLEQLRWLEAGIPIKVGITDVATIGIDTPADLQRAVEYLEKNKA